MHAKTLLVMIFLVTLLSLSQVTRADIYHKCPDSANIYQQKITWEGQTISQKSDVTHQLCTHQEVTLKRSFNKKDFLSSVWYPSSLPEGDVQINSILFIANISAFTSYYSTTSIDFYWQCGNDTPDIETPTLISTKQIGRKFQTINLNITKYTENCDREYQVITYPQSSLYYQNTTITKTDILVDYSVGIQPQPSVLNTRIDVPKEVQKYTSEGNFNEFTVTGDVSCENAYCGNVNLSLQYFNGNEYLNIPTEQTGISPFYTTDNPYSCGEMEEGDACSHTWIIHNTRYTRNQTYHFSLTSESDIPAVQSSISYGDTKINTGILSLHSSFSENPVYVNQQTQFKTILTCSLYNCGKIRVFAKNASSTIVNDSLFSISPENPYAIGPMTPGDTKDVAWDITVSVPGGYPIYSVAKTNGIETYYSEIQELSVSPSGAGILTSEDIVISPSTIYEGDTTTVSANISCTGDSYATCGTVSVYIKANNTNLPAYGLTTPVNPVTYSQYPCLQNMNSGDSCDVQWDVTGNEAGNYDITVYPSSDKESVTSTESSPEQLIVKKHTGDILISSQLTPNTINESSYTLLQSHIECTTEYCGSIDVSARYNDDSLITSQGNLTTLDDNPAHCDSLPCDIQWNITGRVSGTYIIKTLALSDENIQNSTSVALSVQDPEKPPEPKLSIASIDDVVSQSNSGFNIMAAVFCSGASCGDVASYVQYFDGSWKNLTEDTPLKTSKNLQTFHLDAGESKTLSWSINTTTPQNFSLRVIAESAVAYSDDEFSVEVLPPGEIAIEILSPSDGDTFSRGDLVNMKIEVTENGNPKNDAMPMASFSDDLSPDIILQNDGNGYYKSSFVVPPYADGHYTITFSVNGKTKTTDIIVDPTLEVTFSTDKDTYKIPEQVKIEGEVTKKGMPENATLTIEMLCGDWASGKTEIHTSGSGDFSYAYSTEKVPPRECTITLEAKDDYGNHGTVSRNITLQKSENDIYNVTFLSPNEGDTFIAGGNITISVSVETPASPVRNATVTCTDVASYTPNEITLKETRIPGTYSTTLYGIKKQQHSDPLSITCIAKTPDGFFGTGFINIKIVPAIIIDVIEPSVNETERGETLRFVVRAYHSYDGFSRNLPLENATLVLKSLNESRELNFSYTGNGKYELDYPVSAEGDIVFRILVEDSNGVMQSSDMQIRSVSRVRVNFAAIALVIAGLIVLLSAYLIHKTKKSKTIVKTVVKTVVKGPDRKEIIRNKIKDLQKKAKAIEKAKEDAEMEYYQRKLSEKEFKSMMENYEQDLLKIKEEIAEFEKELRSLETKK